MKKKYLILAFALCVVLSGCGEKSEISSKGESMNVSADTASDEGASVHNDDTGTASDNNSQEDTKQEESNKDYILPDSGIRNLTEQDLRGLSDEELRLARNEIYARHGRKFKNKELQDYFESKSWYHGTIEPGEWSESFLNKYDTYNVKFISDYED